MKYAFLAFRSSPILHSLSALLLIGCGTTPTLAGDYSNNPEARAFVEEVSKRHGWPREEVQAIIDQAEKKDSIIKAISRPAEAKPWYEYRPIFLNSSRIEGGVEYWDEQAEILQRVSDRLDVDPRVIVAIIGVETRYGRHAGRYRVLDALATLGFDYPPRGAFFRKELEQFLLLSREEKVSIDEALGSYAGAMGHGQFIPSSYRHYAVDFDGDGKRDLWHSREDIIASVGNYLHVHGWQPGEPVAIRATVKGEKFRELLEKGVKPSIPAAELAGYGVTPDSKLPPDTQVGLIELEGRDAPEYWVILNNFYVITRYNRSPLYAMAVNQLADSIAEERREELAE